MIGKAYTAAKSAIGKLLVHGDRYLSHARHIGKSLTPFYHSSGLSSIPMIRDVVQTAGRALTDYDALKKSLMGA